MRLVQFEHAPQNIAGRHGDRAAVSVETVVNHLRGGFGGPGHDTDRARIGLQHDVDIRWIHRALIVRIIARHGLQKDRLRQAHALFLRKFFRGHELAARHARHVGNDRFDFRDTVLFQELLNRAGHNSPCGCAHAAGFTECGEQRARKWILCKLPLRMPLQSEGETRAIRHPERLDNAVRSARLDE